MVTSKRPRSPTKKTAGNYKPEKIPLFFVPEDEQA